MLAGVVLLLEVSLLLATSGAVHDMLEVLALAPKTLHIFSLPRASLMLVGVVLLLDVSLLLTTPAAAIHALLEQLHSVKQLMNAGAVVVAYSQQNHLEAAAAQHLGDANRWREYMRGLSGQGAPELCHSLLPKLTSNTKVPEGTHVLRSAYKVSRA
jgi:hypothetical protein